MATKKGVLISGASSGIGAATARLFSEKGYFCYLLGRNEERLSQVALQCRSGASLLKADLTNDSQLKKYIGHLSERPDVDLEVLVNNAGIFEQHDFLEGGLDLWRRQFETNLFGTIALTMGVLPLFYQKNKGSIVNVSSGLGLRPSPKASAYSAAKAALNAWTSSLAQEAGPKGVRVNAISPGLVDTPIHSFNQLPESERLAAKKQMDTYQPLGRMGTPDEIAQAIYFLGAESAWTTGANLTVDGGINLP